MRRLLAVLWITLLQTQTYYSPAGRVIDQNIINRGQHVSMDGCLAMAKSWAQTFAASKYRIEREDSDGYRVTRPVAIGTEVITLRCK
jgi:hypothetical protein